MQEFNEKIKNCKAAMEIKEVIITACLGNKTKEKWKVAAQENKNVIYCFLQEINEKN